MNSATSAKVWSTKQLVLIQHLHGIPQSQGALQFIEKALGTNLDLTTWNRVVGTFSRCRVHLDHKSILAGPKVSSFRIPEALLEVFLGITTRVNLNYSALGRIFKSLDQMQRSVKKENRNWKTLHNQRVKQCQDLGIKLEPLEIQKQQHLGAMRLVGEDNPVYTAANTEVKKIKKRIFDLYGIKATSSSALAKNSSAQASFAITIKSGPQDSRILTMKSKPKKPKTSRKRKLPAFMSESDSNADMRKLSGVVRTDGFEVDQDGMAVNNEDEFRDAVVFESSDDDNERARRSPEIKEEYID